MTEKDTAGALHYPDAMNDREVRLRWWENNDGDWVVVTEARDEGDSEWHETMRGWAETEPTLQKVGDGEFWTCPECGTEWPSEDEQVTGGCLRCVDLLRYIEYEVPDMGVLANDPSMVRCYNDECDESIVVDPDTLVVKEPQAVTVESDTYDMDSGGRTGHTDIEIYCCKECRNEQYRRGAELATDGGRDVSADAWRRRERALGAGAVLWAFGVSAAATLRPEAVATFLTSHPLQTAGIILVTLGLSGGLCHSILRAANEWATADNGDLTSVPWEGER